MAVRETQKINHFETMFRALSDEEPEDGGVPEGGDDLDSDQPEDLEEGEKEEGTDI